MPPAEPIGPSLLKEIENTRLLHELILQLNKDIALAGLDFKIVQKAAAQEIVAQLQSLLFECIKTDFDGYLNFLYRVDVSEHILRSLKESDPLMLSQKVTWIVLQREWQKVWFKSKNQ